MLALLYSLKMEANLVLDRAQGKAYGGFPHLLPYLSCPPFVSISHAFLLKIILKPFQSWALTHKTLLNYNLVPIQSCALVYHFAIALDVDLHHPNPIALPSRQTNWPLKVNPHRPIISAAIRQHSLFSRPRSDSLLIHDRGWFPLPRITF